MKMLYLEGKKLDRVIASVEKVDKKLAAYLRKQAGEVVNAKGVRL